MLSVVVPIHNEEPPVLALLHPPDLTDADLPTKALARRSYLLKVKMDE